jgi:outer membrane protein with beta-barrel domain
MRIRSMAAALLILVSGGPAFAQDFGVMESAETINRGNIKLMAYPMLVFGQAQEDSQFGVAGRAGYGFTDSLDAEAKVSFFKNLVFIGADVEFWLVKGGSIDVSVIGGGHIANGSHDVVDTKGLDLTGLASTHLTDSLELYGALDFAFEKISDAPSGFDDSFHTVHLVPGLEYKITEDLDFDAEVGFALNDAASSYLAGGLAYYIR